MASICNTLSHASRSLGAAHSPLGLGVAQQLGAGLIEAVLRYRLESSESYHTLMQIIAPSKRECCLSPAEEDGGWRSRGENLPLVLEFNFDSCLLTSFTSLSFISSKCTPQSILPQSLAARKHIRNGSRRMHSANIGIRKLDAFLIEKEGKRQGSKR
jgi:hypothetical protein